MSTKKKKNMHPLSLSATNIFVSNLRALVIQDLLQIFYYIWKQVCTKGTQGYSSSCRYVYPLSKMKKNGLRRHHWKKWKINILTLHHKVVLNMQASSLWTIVKPLWQYTLQRELYYLLYIPCKIYKTYD